MPTTETTDPVDDGQAPEELAPAAILPRLIRVPGGIPNVDARLEECAEVSEDHVLMRVQPELYFPTGRTVQRTYVRWTGVQWGLELNVEQAKLFRHDLDHFVNEWVRRRQGEQEGR